MEFFLILGSFSAVTVFFFWVLKNLNSWYYAAKLGKLWRQLPPGYMSFPFIGSTLHLVKHMIDGQTLNFFKNFPIRYGASDMYKTHLYGRPTIITYTPEACRQVLSDENRFIPSYPSAVNILSGRKSLMRASKTEHRRLRRLSTVPITGQASLAIYINHIEDTVIKGLEEWGSMQKPIELLTEIKSLTFKVICNIFMGSKSLHSSMAQMEKIFYKVADGILSFPIAIPGTTFHKALKARKRLVEMLQSILTEKRLEKKNGGKKESGKDMMDVLIEVRDEEDGQQLDDETIIDLIFGKLFAGHETSAYTAMWALIFITQHPNVFQKAKEEQENIVKQRPSGQNGVNLAEVKQMKYLYQIIDETLRTGGITNFLFREAAYDIEMNGKIIPKGWRVLPIVGMVHENEVVYPSSKEFNPSRWENMTVRPGTFMPFGLGNRYCPGSYLARFEIAIFLHYFLLNYRMERVTPTCEITCIPFPRPKDKCLARIIKVN